MISCSHRLVMTTGSCHVETKWFDESTSSDGVVQDTKARQDTQPKWKVTKGAPHKNTNTLGLCTTKNTTTSPLMNSIQLVADINQLDNQEMMRFYQFQSDTKYYNTAVLPYRTQPRTYIYVVDTPQHYGSISGA